MKIKEEHKALLKELGLGEEDFERFDGKFVKYEVDPEKGVRLYDPDYRTSYNEYIGIDGWSAWSVEKDTFMSNILKGAREKVFSSEAVSPKPDDREIVDALERKFGKGSKPPAK